MSFGERFGQLFRPKTTEEKERQLENVQADFEVSLVPSEYAEKSQELMSLSAVELKEKFPERYRIYLELLRAQKREDSQDENKFNQSDVNAMKRRLVMMNNLDQYVAGLQEGEDTHLREHQTSVFEDLRSFMERGGTSGYVELPTGTGKTVIFVEFLRVLGVPAVVVVPTKDLVTQTQERIRQFSSDANVGAVYSGAKEYDANVVVTTYNSLEKALANPEFDIQSRGIVILDEAHEALGSVRSKVVKEVKGKSLIVGFTATPEYSETKNLGSLLGEKISSMSEREAIESGAKAPCHAMIAKTNYDISTVKITSTGEYDDEELDKIINVAARNKAVAEIAIKKFPEAQKVIFCANVNHAEAVAEQMKEMGETVEVVVGKTQEDVESKYVSLGYKGGWKEAYAKGIISTVLSVDLLTRGTDLPSASVCINAAPTLSFVRAAQRGGRVGRLDPNNPDKHATVIDVVDAGGLDDPSVSEKLRKRRQSVLYYQILGDVVILPRGSKESSGGGGGGGGGKGEDVDIDGITVVVDLEGIISIVPPEGVVEKKFTFELLQQDAGKNEPSSILGQIVTQLEGESTQSLDLIVISGFEALKLITFNDRFARYIFGSRTGTLSLVLPYLKVLHEKGFEEAEEWKRNMVEGKDTIKKFTLELLQQDAGKKDTESILGQLITQLEGKPVSSKDVVGIAGFERQTINALLQRLSKQILGYVLYSAVAPYLKVLHEKGFEEAEEWKRNMVEGKDTIKKFTLELLQQDAGKKDTESILGQLITQLEGKPVSSKEVLTIQGFEAPTIYTLTVRLSSYIFGNNNELTAVLGYLKILHEKGVDASEIWKKERLQEKSFTLEILQQDAGKNDPDSILGQLISQLEMKSTKSTEPIGIRGFETIKVRALLIRLGLVIFGEKTTSLILPYLKVLHERGVEAAEIWKEKQEEKEVSKYFTLELLKQDAGKNEPTSTLGQLISQLEGRSVVSTDVITISGFESPKVAALLSRLSNHIFEISSARSRVLPYLKILHEEGLSAADAFVKKISL